MQPMEKVTKARREMNLANTRNVRLRNDAVQPARILEKLIVVKAMACDAI
jgi:hypothetical protein